VTLLQAIVLGVVQGLTEFLPISSSAHLVIVPWLAGWELEPTATFVFDVLVQVGTLVPLLIIFWADLTRITLAVGRALLRRERPWSGDARLGLWVAVATLPAAGIGIAFKEQVAASFSDVEFVFLSLLITSLMLFACDWFARKLKDLAGLTFWESLWMGLAQALALVPGISRSGATIAAGRTLGLAHADAARFSFLMAIPALAGAGLVAGVDLVSMPSFSAWALPIAVGFLTSAVVGYLAIRWLLAFLTRHGLYVFAVYCLVLGTGGLLLGALRG
jgi:undecaprenyl-diphosphatase